MKFEYSARDGLGKLVRGRLEALDTKGASEVLRSQNLTPIKIARLQSSSLGNIMSTAFGGVNVSELASYTRQLSTMVAAGLPITDALNLLKLQSSPILSTATSAILSDVQQGTALSAAMAKHPKIFSRVYISLIKAGETAGVMDTILLRLADSTEKSKEFRSKVTGAMIYPAIILVGMVIVIVLMMVLVIPRLTALYKDFDAQLPMATRLVIALSDFSVAYWWLVIIIFGVAFWGLRAIIATPTGRMRWDSLLYKLPVVGPLLKQSMVTEMTRTLALLVSVGVSVVEGLSIVMGAVGNVMVEKDLKRVTAQVERGFPLSIAFAESQIFPPIVGQMIAVGEETGKLDDVLSKVSKYFESEVEERVKGLTTAIEPIILMILAVGVGVLMYAVIMPIYTIVDKV